MPIMRRPVPRGDLFSRTRRPRANGYWRTCASYSRVTKSRCQGRIHSSSQRFSRCLSQCRHPAGTNGDAEHQRVAVGSERRKSQRDRVLGLLTQDGSKLNLAIARSWERIASRVDLDFLTPRTRRMLLYPNPLFLIVRVSGSALPASASLLGWAYGPVRPRLGDADRV